MSASQTDQIKVTATVSTPRSGSDFKYHLHFWCEDWESMSEDERDEAVLEALLGGGHFNYRWEEEN